MKSNFLEILSVFSVNLFCGLIANSAPMPFVLLQSLLSSIPLESLSEGLGSPWPTALTSSRARGKLLPGMFERAALKCWEAGEMAPGVVKATSKAVLCLSCGHYA